jgi:hypothetical protein
MIYFLAVDADLLADLTKVKKQRDKLTKENKRLKHELKGLDPVSIWGDSIWLINVVGG